MMTNVGIVDFGDLRRLYKSGKSMFEIAKIYKCSVHKIVYWMSKYGIPRRNHSDASYMKQNPNGDPFKIKKELTIEEAFLYGLGIGIFWGEGNKSAYVSSLRVANTDPDLIKVFISFLKNIYGLTKNRFSYSIVCFNDVDPEESRTFWAKRLKIFPEKFGKITIIPKQGKGTYNRKSLYGVCTVQANNVKLKKLVFDRIEEIRNKYRDA